MSILSTSLRLRLLILILLPLLIVAFAAIYWRFVEARKPQKIFSTVSWLCCAWPSRAMSLIRVATRFL